MAINYVPKFQNELEELRFAKKVYLMEFRYSSKVVRWAFGTLERFHDKYGTVDPAIIKSLIN